MNEDVVYTLIYIWYIDRVPSFLLTSSPRILSVFYPRGRIS
jgi:hypothetical protein